MNNLLPVLNLQTYQEITGLEHKHELPIKVLQIGDGNFIRGFVDWMIYEMNKKTGFQGGVVSIQATPNGKTVPKLNKQDGLFTLLLRGIEEGEIVNNRQVINSIREGISPYTNWSDVLELAENEDVEFLFSNTTEAGIRYEQEEFVEGVSPLSFPGKVVSLLYRRFVHFNGQADKGWILIPCELIENNGDQLKEICLKIAMHWQLPTSFSEWLDHSCTFCNTLVDRIVPGYPGTEADTLFDTFGYSDELLTVAEPYHLFVIEGPDFIERKLPFKEAGLNVQFDKIELYRELKVKLLNAPHTMLSSMGLVSEVESVKEGMEDPLLFSFINNALAEEICATLPVEGKEKATSFIEQVFDRFANPYIHHRLADISLNSFSKFKARIWPSFIAYRTQFEKNPRRLVFAFASLVYYFKGVQEGAAANYEVLDDAEVIRRFKTFYREFDGSFAQCEQFIDTLLQDEFSLSDDHLRDVSTAIAKDFLYIYETGMRSALQKLEDEY